MATHNKLSKEIINERLAPRGIVMLGKYKTNRDKTLFQCKNGHKWMGRPGNVLISINCPQCVGGIAFSHKFVAKQLLMRGFKLLNQYVNKSTKVLLQCQNNHKWETYAATALRKTSKCPGCGGKQYWTPALINKQLLPQKIQLVGQYNGSHTKTLFQCQYGHKWETRPSVLLSQKSGCPQCLLEKRTLTLKEVNARLKNRGILITGQYVNTKQKTQFKCLQGHTWTQTAAAVLHGSGCQKCATNASEFNFNYILDSGKEKNGKRLVKFGISSANTNAFQRRIKGLNNDNKKAGLNFTMSIILAGRVKDAKVVESKLLAIGSKAKLPNFNGYTEFRWVTPDELKAAIKVLKQSIIKE